MGALIQINAVPNGSKVVPYGQPVNLLNADVTGTVNQRWEVLNYPNALTSPDEPDAVNFPGWTYDAPSKTYFLNQGPVDIAANTPAVFTPDVTGNYLIRLTSFETVGPPKPTQATVQVLEFYTGEQVQAAGETIEGDAFRGWAEFRNHAIKAIGKRQGLGTFLRVLNITSPGVRLKDRIVRVIGIADARQNGGGAVPPGATTQPEFVASIDVANPGLPDVGNYLHGIVVADIADSGFGWIQIAGVSLSDVGYATVGNPIYCGALGVQQVAATALQAGRVISTNPGEYALWITLDGSGGSASSGAVADWDINTIRYYAVDYDAGNDSNVGYSDVDLPTAGTLALKTLERLTEIFPKYGNARTACIVIKARAGGATYRNPANSADGLLNATNGIFGYERVTIRATGSLPGEGIVAFSNTAADRTALGARIVPGTNVAGYNVATSVALTILSVTPGAPIAITTTAPHGLVTGDRVYVGDDPSIPGEAVIGAAGTQGYNTITFTGLSSFTLDKTSAYKPYVSGGKIYTWKVTLAGGGAPAFTPDTNGGVNALIGKRIRFSETTTTPALRGLCAVIHANGVDTIVTGDFATSFPAIAPTDVFFIEEPGVAVGSVLVTQDDKIVNGGYMEWGYIAGIRTTSAFIIGGTRTRSILCFCESDTFLYVLSVDDFETYKYFTDENYNFTYAGIGFRHNHATIPPQITDARTIYLDGIYVPRVRVIVTRASHYEIVSGYLRTLFLHESGINQGVNVISIGVRDFSRWLRVVGPSGTIRTFDIRGSNGTFNGVDIGSGDVGGDTTTGIRWFCSNTAWAILNTRVRTFNNAMEILESEGNGIVIDHETVRLYGIDSALSTEPGFTSGFSTMQQPDLDSADFLDPTNNRWLVYQSALATLQTSGVVAGPAQVGTNHAAGMLTHRVLRFAGVTSTNFPLLQRLALALADVDANCQRIVGVSRSYVKAFLTDDPVLYENMGHSWIEFEVAPALGDVAYLSQITAGLARAYAPGVGGPGAGPVVRLGTVMRINGTLGLVRWNPDDDPTA